MFQILYSVTHWLLPIVKVLIVPVCLVLAWSIPLLAGWSIWVAARDSVAKAKQMHKIPCSGCQYFTGSYQLKCAVHPDLALSEAAIDCPDYHPGVDALSIDALRD